MGRLRNLAGSAVLVLLVIALFTTGAFESMSMLQRLGLLFGVLTILTLYHGGD